MKFMDGDGDGDGDDDSELFVARASHWTRDILSTNWSEYATSGLTNRTCKSRGSRAYTVLT